MRVLIFTTQFWQLGGAERLAVELAEDLNRHGVHADVLSMYSSNLTGVPERSRELRQRGIPAVHFLGLKVGPGPASVLRATASLRRLLRRERYDIVETSLMGPRVLALWATLGLRTRHVAGVHEVFSRARSDERKFPLWRACLRRNHRTRFYAVSEFARREWSEYSGAELRHIRTIHNAISDEWFGAHADRARLRAELAIPENARIALFVGRMIARKGVETTVEALGPLLERENCYLVCVGASEPAHRRFPEDTGFLERLHARIDREGWRPRLRFLGLRNDVPRLMASSDLLVHPPRYEAFGLVLVEAMAAGLPLVASNVEGIPEVLSGTDYPIVAADDTIALRHAIEASLRRPAEETARVVQRGRGRAAEFTRERRSAEMIKLFDDVLTDAF